MNPEFYCLSMLWYQWLLAQPFGYLWEHTYQIENLCDLANEENQ